MELAIIFDIDGTLSDLEHRIHHIRDDSDLKKKKDWFSFYQEAADDTPIRPLCDLANVLSLNGYRIIFITGRPLSISRETVEWLHTHTGIPVPRIWENLFMRRDGDRRSDYEVKAEIYNQHVRGKYKLEFVIEDRDQCVRLWRELGLICLQCRDGNF
jgi:hypothetical protein